MKRRSYTGRVTDLQNDPIRMLKAEHHMTLLRLETIEWSLQYVDRFRGPKVPDGCAGEQARLKDSLAAFDHGVGRHFLKEEQVLFPVLAEYMGRVDGAIDAMVDEHARIRRALAELRKMIDDLCECKGDGRAPILSCFMGLADETFDFIRLHICKENQILFAICEASLSANEKREIAIKIKSM